MRFRFAGILVVMAAGLLFVQPARADRATAGVQGMSVNCPARLQLRHPGRCQHTDTRGEMTALAVEGILPERPLPIRAYDETLGEIPYTYLRASDDGGTPLYTSLPDAVGARNAYRVMEPGFVFFSWLDWYDREGEIIYMVEPGIYIRGGDVSRVSPSSFHGIMLNGTPERPFAWVLGQVKPSTAPGRGAPTLANYVYRYEIVQIYDMVEVDGWTWYQVGPDAWIEQRLMGVVFPEAEAPEGVANNRWISVNLYEQTIAAYENGEMVFATLVSTGIGGWWTQPGLFQVYEKLETDFMQGAFEADRSDFYYLEDVPWILYYDQSRALHGAYWHNGFGYPRSHGCVNLSPADAEWIYEWSIEGTWVYVFDPSGETPTDEELYGAGGF